MVAITSPLAGKATSQVSFSGYFDENSPPPAHYDNPLDAHDQKGWLRKTPWNLGTIFTANAGNLFTAGMGMVRMRLSLPHNIVNGVYDPVRDTPGRTLTDLVLWGANFGDFYITPPGIYAAFTPTGTEFTIWTSSGKVTVLDTLSNVSSGQDVVMEFAWDYKRFWMDHSVALYVNSRLVAWSDAKLNNESFSSLYKLSGGDYVHANFYCMDSPLGKNSLNAVLKKMGTYRHPEDLPSGMTGQVMPMPMLRKLPEASVSASGLSVEYGFDFTGITGTAINIAEPDFNVVFPVPYDLSAIGFVGSVRNDEGPDAGAEPSGIYPQAPESLPFGFEEVRERQ